MWNLRNVPEGDDDDHSALLSAYFHDFGESVINLERWKVSSVEQRCPRRLLFKRPPIPLDRVELPKRTRGDEDDHSTFSAYHHDLEKVSENVKNGNASALEQGCLTCWTALGLRCKLQLKRQRTKH